MVFNFSLLFRVVYKALFKTRGTHDKLTPKRIFVLLEIAFFCGFAEITGWLGFLLDTIFFPGYRQQLDDIFPDAKFVYMARTPFETVPSTVSLVSYYFSTVMSPLHPCPFLDDQLHMLSLYYNYPLMKFKDLPPDRQHIIRYTELVERPAQTVTDLCAAFGLEMNPAYTQLLERKQSKAQRFKRTHEYSLEKFGLTREVIIEKYAAVFDRFGFEKNA